MAEQILNKESGWRALTGTTDFGAIAAAGPEDPARRLAFDLFVDRVCGFVGAYYVSLAGRVDALVFAGGIGERSARLRRAVVAQCACLGFAVDDARNGDDAGGEAGEEAAAVVREVGDAAAPHRVLVVRTDEQFEMARGAAEDPALWVPDDQEEEDVPGLTLLRVKSGHD